MILTFNLKFLAIKYYTNKAMEFSVKDRIIEAESEKR